METPSKNTRGWRTGIGAGLLLAIQLGVVLLARRLPTAADAVAWSTALAAAGTLTIAWVVAPLTPYRKAAHWISAAVLAGGIVLSANILPADVWLRTARQELWLIAWFPLMMATIPASRQGVCAPRSAHASWLLVGVSAFLGALVTFAGLISAWRHGS